MRVVVYALVLLDAREVPSYLHSSRLFVILATGECGSHLMGKGKRLSRALVSVMEASIEGRLQTSFTAVSQTILYACVVFSWTDACIAT